QMRFSSWITVLIASDFERDRALLMRFRFLRSVICTSRIFSILYRIATAAFRANGMKAGSIGGLTLQAIAEVERFRSRFPVFRKKIYLNSCSQGALSDAVEASLLEHIRTWHEAGSPWDRWVEEYEGARSAFARFINAKPEEVAVLSCASAGISSVASSLE